MKEHKQHIVILCSRLNLPGGIERAIANLANLLSEKERTVSLLVLDNTSESFYPLHSSVAVHQYPLFFGIKKSGNTFSRKFEFVQNIRSLKRQFAFLKPDVVIATEYPFAIAAVLSGYKKTKILSWEHHHFFELKQSRFWQMVCRFCYPRLHAIVCLNEDEKKLFHQLNQKVVVIPNFIVQAKERESQPIDRQKHILTIARLTDVKGIDNLLLVARDILQRFPQWRWKLIGDGEKKNDVTSFINENALEDRLVVQQPKTHLIQNEYREASLYVMTSKNECFPMTLLEAMQNGLPCIAFDCETGPRAIIQHKINGLLAEPENVEAMSEAIAFFLTNKVVLKNMSRTVIESVERFSAERVYALWNRLLRTL